MVLPPLFLARLSDAEHAALRRLLALGDARLASVYAENVIDHQESRGDDGQLFGFKIYKHLRYGLMQDLVDEPDIEFVEDNGAYFLRIGPLHIRIDSLGHFADEDARRTFPDASPTKNAVGWRNADQLQMAMPGLYPQPDENAYALNHLTVGHFGNAREGLVKWYLGAWTRRLDGNAVWAWIERQDDAAEDDFGPLAPRQPVVPFDERPADEIVIRPRETA